VQALADTADELIATLTLEGVLAQGVLAGDAAAAQTLTAMVGLFRAAAVPSLLPLVTSAGEVLLVASASGLPGGTSLVRRRADFRWFTLPLEADVRTGSLERDTGSRNTFTYAGAGNASQVTALMAIAAGRRGNPDPRRRRDPFDIGVGFASPSALLNITQYEYLMNLLERLHPIGVSIDTSAIRAAHVDPTGSGTPVSLGQRISRTFRPFRMRRHASGAQLIEND
jgi:hypothetical protein